MIFLLQNKIIIKLASPHHVDSMSHMLLTYSTLNLTLSCSFNLLLCTLSVTLVYDALCLYLKILLKPAVSRK